MPNARQLSPLAIALMAAFSTPLHANDVSATQSLSEVTVTGTREARPIAETPNTVDTVGGERVREQRPTHPSQVMNQVPGVWVSNLSGEGHSTAIRQPLTTSPLYLYLEDGIPTRSTGFFNHNALYEINVPQSGGLEISKGPGSALYGSDAIGGTINVLTRTPPSKAEFEASAEAGSYGWGRVMLTGGNASANDAWRASLNLTTNQGYQDKAHYDRQTGNIRWDRALGNDAMLKTIFSFSLVDQNHVGSLSEQQYDDSQARKTNNIPFSYRKVEAFRLSAAYEKDLGNALISITPYLRDNSMEILPSWMVSYDPVQYTTKNQSFGFLAKYRHDFEPLRARLIVGLDFDLSPGSRDEESIRVLRGGTPITGRSYTLVNSVAPVTIYDYDVTYRGISPYIHGEISPIDKLRLIAGLRYDSMQYDYENNMNGGGAGATQGVAGFFPAGGFYGHVADTKVKYHHLGPKLGATYEFSPAVSGFANYSNSFRTPSEGQVFRGSRESSATAAQLAAESLLHLKPVIVDNYEAGLRGKAGKVNYEVSVYRMKKKDDIVSYRDPGSGQRTVVNAGETLHRGIEFGLGVPFADVWRVDLSLSYAKHTYEKWTVSGTDDYSGKEMEAAPRVIANTRLTYAPGYMNGGRVQLEWFRLGSYYHDQANTTKYDGHSLLNLRANYPFDKRWEVFGSVTNLTDRKYAETVGMDGTEPTYAIGQPRLVVLGVQAKW